MNKQELYEKRKELIAKTIQREKTNKVPLLMLADTYIPFYAGVNLNEIKSYDQAIEINKKVYSELQCDGMTMAFMPPNLIMAPKLKLLDGGVHVIGKDGSKQINPEAVVIMEPEEYPELIKDPFNYLLETVYPRRYKLLASDDPQKKFDNILGVYSEIMKMVDYFIKTEAETGIPAFVNGGYYVNPVDLIFDFLRDFKGIVRDIKKSPEWVRDAGLAMVDGAASLFSTIPPVENKALLCPMHIPAFLKPKDFEKAYWPSFKKLTELLVEQGHNVAFLFEKNYTHLHEYLQELPKKNIIGFFEEDDLHVVKEKLGGTMAIAGGLSTRILQYGTKNECIDHVKGLIDDFGRDGGYFITPSTPMMYSADGKPENLRAVAEYVNTQNF